MGIFVSVSDEEGFTTSLVGPFESKSVAFKWVDIQMITYDGDLQEPFQINDSITSDEFDKLKKEDDEE